MKIQNNVPLALYTTFQIGGPAGYFVRVRTGQELIKAVRFAGNKSLPYFILGGGSNLLVNDDGFEGLVIKNEISGIKNFASGLTIGSGILMSELVRYFMDKDLAGLEWAAGIPGTLGGAICGNASAYGGSMAGLIKKVEVLNLKTGQKEVFDSQECGFRYRQTVFKENKSLFILFAGLRPLCQGCDCQKAKEIFRKRKGKQPLEFASAGCVFKNFHFSEAEFDDFMKDRKIGLSAPAVKNKVIPAAQLIEECGLKGAKNGRAMISKKHANFIVNPGRSSARDVLGLIDLARNRVRQKFGLDLETEIRYISRTGEAPLQPQTNGCSARSSAAGAGRQEILQ